MIDSIRRVVTRCKLHVRLRLLRSFKLFKEELYFSPFLLGVTLLASFLPHGEWPGAVIWIIAATTFCVWAYYKGHQRAIEQYQQQPKVVNPINFGMIAEIAALALCSILTAGWSGAWWILAKTVWVASLGYRVAWQITLIGCIRNESNEQEEGYDKYLQELITDVEHQLYPEKFPDGPPVSETSLSRTNGDSPEHLTERGLSSAEEDDSQSVSTEN